MPLERVATRVPTFEGARSGPGGDAVRAGRRRRRRPTSPRPVADMFALRGMKVQGFPGQGVRLIPKHPLPLGWVRRRRWRTIRRRTRFRRLSASSSGRRGLARAQRWRRTRRRSRADGTRGGRGRWPQRQARSRPDGEASRSRGRVDDARRSARSGPSPADANGG